MKSANAVLLGISLLYVLWVRIQALKENIFLPTYWHLCGWTLNNWSQLTQSLLALS